uniref:General odorant-binding protein 28a n=1 Tax=Cacopsylla melanoneura TaxID=428564 RepID=A0A8D8VYG3_9HEMI
MKCQVFLACFCVGTLLWGRRVAASDQDNRERVQQIYAKCMSEVQAEDKDLEGFRKMQIPDSDKGKCMMACLMKEAGIIENSKFSKEGAEKLAERYYGENVDDMNKARSIIDNCDSFVSDETEECNLATKLAFCVVEEAQKVGLSSVPGG